jgi:hypothetical protein
MTMKRIFYASGSGLDVFVYDGRAFLGELAFGPDEAGRAAFADYIAQDPAIVSHLIVDVIEEEYRNETIPHLFGADRRTVVARKLEQSFRNTPYRAAQLQGRTPEGRRDDRILLAALTNPEALAAVLEPLARHKVPLAGVCSAPMLAVPLLRRLGLKTRNTLLLTRNRQGFLRQTFLHHHELKNSRLSPLTADEYNPALLAQEIERNRRYLHRLRLLAHDAALDAVILGERDFIAGLRAAWRDTDALRYHLIEIGEATRAVGLAEDAPGADCERLFVHLLSRHAPAVDYAQAPERRGYRLHQFRKVLLGAGCGLVMGGAAWASMNVADGLALGRQTETASRGAASLQADYEHAIAGRPAMEIGVEEMRWIVQAGETIGQLNTDPWAALRALSGGVSIHPAIHVDEVEWSAAAPADVAALDPATDSAAGAAGENVLIKGRVEPFDGDLRAAYDEVEAFMATLRADPRFGAVSAVTLPVNTDPQATVAGIAGVQADGTKAAFEIKAILRVGS